MNFSNFPKWMLLCITLFTWACVNEDKRSSTGIEIPDNLPVDQLAEIYCSKCHLYTSPDLLDKSTWPAVLKQMRYFLGLRYPGENPFKGKGLQEGLYLETAQVFPEQSVISTEAWQEIEAYFLEQAPDTLHQVSKQYPVNQLFEARLESPDLGGFPAITMLDFDDVNKHIYVGDINGQVVELNAEMERTNFTQLRNPIVKSIRRHDSNELLLLDIGIMDPKDLPFGAVIRTDISSFSTRSLIFEELSRPVDFALEDLDLDGREDFVTCNFGHLVGNLSWYRNTDKGYQKNMLSDKPGAIKVEVLDVEADGDQDLIVLFAHGNECIVRYVNDGLGNFQEDTLIQMHPLFGSADFDLLDFDADGDLDILLANGDNSDQSQILKPYHGIRLFINDGDFHFEERFFFPMNGAFKVIAHDFDQDSDQDIFAISFYPDFNAGLDQSLVFLENQGGLDFSATGFHQAPKGRWMVLDKGDIDQDGDVDILVGSFALGPGAVPEDVLRGWRTSSDHLLVLENKIR